MLDTARHPIERGPTTADPTLARSLHTAAVVTPEAVLLEFRAAGIASRALAKGIDLIIQFFSLYAVLLASIVVLAGGSETVAVIFIIVAIFLVFFGYPMLEAVWNGQTLGKKALGIRVITTEGGPVRVRHAAIRAMVWIVEFMLPPGGLFALAAALLTPRSQRIGDLAAGTVVIRATKVQSLPVFFSPFRGAEQFSSSFDAGRLTPHDYALIREFLTRAHELVPSARTQVATELASRVELVAGRPRPPEIGPEAYLVTAVYAYQRRFTPDAAPPPPPGSAPPRPPGVTPSRPPGVSPPRPPGVSPPPMGRRSAAGQPPPPRA